MSEKKGFEIPGREGRWEEVLLGELDCEVSRGYGRENNYIKVYIGRDATSDYTFLRRLPNPPPMPNIVPGDSIVIGTSQYVVFDPKRKLAADLDGVWRSFTEEEILEVWREGGLKWRRHE
jgi:hypothetical protein